MLPIYCKLFNVIFKSGLVPESWSVGTIKTIFKNKGIPKLPENYRPITIISCFSKLFTSVINRRLNKYAEEVELIEACQAGIRKNHSTTDNIFIIKSLIDIAKSRKDNLHCCFIDFKHAFDTVWRGQLWQKLVKHHINGKCLLQNMYKNIKSNVTVNNNSSAFFPCQTGVRQGENLSPFLFSIFLNDLEMFLLSRNVQGITCDINYDEISVYIKLLVLLFADDTVLFGSSQSELQHALNQFEKYCEEMQLTVNTAKIKVIIVTNKRNIKQPTFTFQSKTLDVVTDYKYLGIYFAKNGSFTLAKKQVAEQANKALFSWLKKIEYLDLPYDLQIDTLTKQ